MRNLTILFPVTRAGTVVRGNLGPGSSCMIGLVRVS
jgi:hypothetical protein